MNLSHLWLALLGPAGKAEHCSIHSPTPSCPSFRLPAWMQTPKRQTAQRPKLHESIWEHFAINSEPNDPYSNRGYVNICPSVCTRLISRGVGLAFLFLCEVLSLVHIGSITPFPQEGKKGCLLHNRGCQCCFCLSTHSFMQLWVLMLDSVGFWAFGEKGFVFSASTTLLALCLFQTWAHWWSTLVVVS